MSSVDIILPNGMHFVINPWIGYVIIHLLFGSLVHSISLREYKRWNATSNSRNISDLELTILFPLRMLVGLPCCIINNSICILRTLGLLGLSLLRSLATGKRPNASMKSMGTKYPLFTWWGLYSRAWTTATGPGCIFYNGKEHCNAWQEYAAYQKKRTTDAVMDNFRSKIEGDRREQCKRMRTTSPGAK